MKTLVIILFFATSISAQYANRFDQTEFIADQKIIGNDTIQGEWIILLQAEWPGHNLMLFFNGKVLDYKRGVYKDKETSVYFDRKNKRVEVKTKDETYYLIRIEDQ